MPVLRVGVSSLMLLWLAYLQEYKCIRNEGTDQRSAGCDGDRQAYCSFITSPYCYSEPYPTQCCKTCTGHHTGVTGCEYGDKNRACNPADCHKYNEHTRTKICCHSCSTTTAASASTATAAPVSERPSPTSTESVLRASDDKNMHSANYQINGQENLHDALQGHSQDALNSSSNTKQTAADSQSNSQTNQVPIATTIKSKPVQTTNIPATAYKSRGANSQPVSSSSASLTATESISVASTSTISTPSRLSSSSLASQTSQPAHISESASRNIHKSATDWAVKTKDQAPRTSIVASSTEINDTHPDTSGPSFSLSTKKSDGYATLLLGVGIALFVVCTIVITMCTLRLSRFRRYELFNRDIAISSPISCAMSSFKIISEWGNKEKGNRASVKFARSNSRSHRRSLQTVSRRLSHNIRKLSGSLSRRKSSGAKDDLSDYALCGDDTDSVFDEAFVTSEIPDDVDARK